MKLLSKNNALGIVIFTVFIDLLGYGILIPVIPIVLADPGSPFYILPAGYSVASGYILLGLLIAIFPLAQFFATPILGQLSDRHGRKKLLAISLAGTCISYILFAIGLITKNIPLLFVSRALDGITGGNISIAQAIIADVTPPEHRAKNFGLIGAAFGMGFILGPFIGGVLSNPNAVSWFNAATPFWFAAILSFLNILSVIIFLPETLSQRQETKTRWLKSIRNIGQAFGIKEFQVLFTVSFLFWNGFTFFTTFLSVYLITRFGFTQGNIGNFFAYIGIWVAFTQIVLTRQLIKRFRENQILKVTLITAGSGILLYFLPFTWWGTLLFVAPFFAVSNGLTQANMAGLVSKTAKPTEQGTILGLNSSVQALAQIAPPLLAGIIAGSISPHAPMALAAFFILGAGIVFLISYKPAPTFILPENKKPVKNHDLRNPQCIPGVDC